MEKCKKSLNFFENNFNKCTDNKIIWDVSKAFVQGQFIQQNKMLNKKTRKDANNSKWYKDKEDELMRSPGKSLVAYNPKINQYMQQEK